MASFQNLLSDTVRVQAPFIRVDIGGYTFGVYEEKQRDIGKNGLWRNVSEKFPNFVQSLQIKKINGTVNTYVLNLIYPITFESDPNFFEKVLSHVSDTRKITFTYGDSMLPEDIYAEEEALITKVSTNVDLKSARITYNITAIGDTAKAFASQYSWKAHKSIQPSKLIANILNIDTYGVTNIFSGMKNRDPYEFIDADDKLVDIPTIPNSSVMDYIATLVSYMIPANSTNDSVIQNNVYMLAVREDLTGRYGGPYFEVRKVQNSGNTLHKLCNYEVDVGFPTMNIIESFTIDNSDNWSIFYDYNRQASSSDYVKRLNSKGELEYIYNPQLTNGHFDLEATDKSWWTKVTEFPITAKMRIRGLLKPAILMEYVKINVWVFGKKHISSGYYLISGEDDEVGMNGYFTTLSLIRVAGDDDNALDGISSYIPTSTGYDYGNTPDVNSGKQGGSYSGGSSTHNSSSGSTHGGGGRRSFDETYAGGGPNWLITNK